MIRPGKILLLRLSRGICMAVFHFWQVDFNFFLLLRSNSAIKKLINFYYPIKYTNLLKQMYNTNYLKILHFLKLKVRKMAVGQCFGLFMVQFVVLCIMLEG